MAKKTGVTALIIAHPGHELRVLGWVATARPFVQVLTDGAGRSQSPRADRSRRLLEELGSPLGSVFGQASDGRFYEAMLAQDADFFIEVLEDLTQSVIDSGVETIFGDAAEGYNPTHDLCRVLIDAVVAQVRRRTGRILGNYAFPLTNWPMAGEPCAGQMLDVVLSDEALAAKLAHCHAYEEMRGEVDSALADAGEEHFRRERFWPVNITRLPSRPHYQMVGEARVRSGRYAQVVGYRQHVEAIAAAIMEHARSGKAGVHSTQSLEPA